ncbi:hypothetical protein SCATT_11600 [Streptantibioticus cattleyicolor NRRL 8057 = DSM 46488]|uniref:Uncharacterized protein n=1 Tax=Streptantibioticus cattleyicolor (strain ATCC 35852 / DSM 46488 / JCM 4925 / NBRC 14057 / NRRL 8057) TaxID=1003195 RepID=G8WQ32_STREN|nr:hypothetical protein SCATT_11600 [Streptantibioticus cattleyicolor NRRL 8057 = DSM 46488]
MVGTVRRGGHGCLVHVLHYRLRAGGSGIRGRPARGATATRRPAGPCLTAPHGGVNVGSTRNQGRAKHR